MTDPEQPVVPDPEWDAYRESLSAALSPAAVDLLDRTAHNSIETQRRMEQNRSEGRGDSMELSWLADERSQLDSEWNDLGLNQEQESAAYRYLRAAEARAEGGDWRKARGEPIGPAASTAPTGGQTPSELDADTGHYDDGHGLGWRSPPAPSLPDDAPNPWQRLTPATRRAGAIGGVVLLAVGGISAAVALSGGGSSPAKVGANEGTVQTSTSLPGGGSASTLGGSATAPPSLSPITAYFNQAAFSTYYTEPVYNPSWTYTWSVSMSIDTDCAQGFQGSTPTPDKAKWYHANTSEGGPCNHSGKAYNSTTGHPGTVRLLITPPDKTWQCELLFNGTAPNNQDPNGPAAGTTPQCQRA